MMRQYGVRPRYQGALVLGTLSMVFFVWVTRDTSKRISQYGYLRETKYYDAVEVKQVNNEARIQMPTSSRNNSSQYHDVEAAVEAKANQKAQMVSSSPIDVSYSFSAVENFYRNHYPNTTMSEKCLTLWEWPSLEKNWEKKEIASQSSNEINLTRFRFTAQRSNAHPTARGSIQITVERKMQHEQKIEGLVDHTPPPLSIFIHVSHRDASSGNVWHRMAVQYEAWIALQVTLHHFFGSEADSSKHRSIDDVSVFFVLSCQNPSDVSQGWSDLGKVVCRGSSEQRQQQQPDYKVLPPTDGLLWDLAWDQNFDCRESNMFQTFVNLYYKQADDGSMASIATTGLEKPTMGCYISRQGYRERMLDDASREAILNLLKRTFADHVSEILISPSDSTARVCAALRFCRVMIGVHGAGMYNTIFANSSNRESPSVIEILPRGREPPAYYRNINMLLGHDYHGLHGDFNMQDKFVSIDVEQVEKALERALRKNSR